MFLKWDYLSRWLSLWLSVSNVITAQSQSIRKWFSVVIDIVPQKLSIKFTIPLSKRTLQMIQFFINAVNVNFLAIQSSVPGNSCLNGAIINECPETVTTKLHSLLHLHRVKPFNYYSITVQVNLQFWKCGKAEQCDEVIECNWPD